MITINRVKFMNQKHLFFINVNNDRNNNAKYCTKEQSLLDFIKLFVPDIQTKQIQNGCVFRLV